MSSPNNTSSSLLKLGIFEWLKRRDVNAIQEWINSNNNRQYNNVKEGSHGRTPLFYLVSNCGRETLANSSSSEETNTASTTTKSRSATVSVVNDIHLTGSEEIRNSNNNNNHDLDQLLGLAKEMLERGGKELVDSKDKNNWTPLHWAGNWIMNK